MNKKLEALIGKWETSDQSSPVVIEISKAKRGLKVRAYNKNDGEEYLTSKTKWDGRSLKFETFVSSNEWHTKNVFRLVSKNKVIQELTYWESWRKISE